MPNKRWCCRRRRAGGTREAVHVQIEASDPLPRHPVIRRSTSSSSRRGEVGKVTDVTVQEPARALAADPELAGVRNAERRLKQLTELAIDGDHEFLLRERDRAPVDGPRREAQDHQPVVGAGEPAAIALADKASPSSRKNHRLSLSTPKKPNQNVD
jgi:hypothetical protein